MFNVFFIFAFIMLIIIIIAGVILVLGTVGRVVVEAAFLRILQLFSQVAFTGAVLFLFVFIQVKFGPALALSEAKELLQFGVADLLIGVLAVLWWEGVLLVFAFWGLNAEAVQLPVHADLVIL